MNRTTQALFTPDWLAADMADLCNIQNNHFVLEPSAGLGALAIAASKKVGKDHILCIELNKDFYTTLEHMDFCVKHANFLWEEPEKLRCDRVLMNPPSKNNDYILHVMHAFKFLVSGGRLVALIVNRFLEGKSPEEQEFLKFIDELNGRLYHIQRPVFVIDDVPVGAALLVLDKK